MRSGTLRGGAALLLVGVLAGPAAAVVTDFTVDPSDPVMGETVEYAAVDDGLYPPPIPTSGSISTLPDRASRTGSRDPPTPTWSLSNHGLARGTFVLQRRTPKIPRGTRRMLRA